MIDRIFSAALTFCLLIAGTLAIGSMLFGKDSGHPAAHDVKVVQLERVVVTGKRGAAAATVAKTEGSDVSAQRLQ